MSDSHTTDMGTKTLHFSKSGDMVVQWADTPQARKVDGLAVNVLEECRRTLMVSMRFLNRALWRMPFQRELVGSCVLGTDGSALFYDPVWVLRRYRQDANELLRTYLHSILHCVFHQPFSPDRHEDTSAWNLACDISVEATALEMAGTRYPTRFDGARRQAMERLKEIAGSLTPNALYSVLESGAAGTSNRELHGISYAEYRRYYDLFFRDGHTAWVCNRGQQEQGEGGYSDGVSDLQKADEKEMQLETAGYGSTDRDGEGTDSYDQPGQTSDRGNEEPEEGQEQVQEQEEAESQASTDSEEGEEQPVMGDNGEGSASDTPPMSDEELEELLEEWTQISKSMEADLQSFSAGDANSLMMDNIAVANRKPSDYSRFLRQFSSMAEDMRLNDDEFDYIFYTYGLDHYGNMPLVEPLEYLESNQVRDFAIVLDTSGSCSGDLLKTFVLHTYDILRQSEGFGDKVNVHIIQCDNRIQSDTKITSLSDIEEYADNFRVAGFGGTDFRPAFDYIDKLVEMKDFDDLRGVLYFTDGMGTFPAHAPDYEVAFIFVDDGRKPPRIPPWAMRVTMTEEEIRQLDS